MANKVARCSWDAVPNSDGYNVYLKGGPTDFYTVYNGVDQYASLGCESYGSLLESMTVEFDYINTINDKTMVLAGTVQDSFSMIFSIQFNQNHLQSLDPDKLYFHLRDGAANQLIGSTTNAHPELSDGLKHRISISFEPIGDLIIYIDGVSVPVTKASSESLTSLVDFQYPLLLGATNARGSAAGFFEGKINDFRLWSDVRTPTEIMDNLDVKLQGIEAGLYAYYPMLDGEGDTIEDVSGANDAPIFGNINNNMWIYDSDSPKSTEFVKQNKDLIQVTNYDVYKLFTGQHEAYATSMLGNAESNPSNNIIFNV